MGVSLLRKLHGLFKHRGCPQFGAIHSRKTVSVSLETLFSFPKSLFEPDGYERCFIHYTGDSK